jgi:hypothetical protein
MMIKTLLPLALVLPAILSPLGVQAQSVPITVGMNYAVARQRLIQAGWQPLIPGGARALWSYGSQDYMNQQMMLAGAFRRQKWFETLGCAPTGLGTCQHQFFDLNGRGLIVETGSGGYGPVPDVTKFYYGDGTKN